MKHVVMYSGGIGSWAAAKRVAEKHGTGDLILLFTDTATEDEDLYRFLQESAAALGGKLVWIKDGRDVWDVFHDVRYLGNTRIDPCSRVLKREPARKWVEATFKPEEVTLYVGIDWSEEHRTHSVKRNWQPYTVEAPMCEEPYLDKLQMMEWAEAEGIKRPRLYDLGMSHNNCGGFCVKAGQGQFYKLLKAMPERYAYHEQREQELRAYLGKDVAFLRKNIKKKLNYITLKDFREMVEKSEAEKRDVAEQVDLFDIGGCGCFGED